VEDAEQDQGIAHVAGMEPVDVEAEAQRDATHQGVPEPRHLREPRQHRLAHALDVREQVAPVQRDMRMRCFAGRSCAKKRRLSASSRAPSAGSTPWPTT